MIDDYLKALLIIIKVSTTLKCTTVDDHILKNTSIDHFVITETGLSDDILDYELGFDKFNTMYFVSTEAIL